MFPWRTPHEYEGFVFRNCGDLQPCFYLEGDLRNPSVRHQIFQTRSASTTFLQRVVEINDREIVVQLQNNGVSAKVLRFFNHNWNPVDVGTTKFDPFYPEYRFPMGVGTTWKQEFRSTNTKGQSYSSFAAAKVVAYEKVTVPAGVFDAYRIESDIEAISTDADANLSKGHIITWYAPALKKYVRKEIIVTANGRVRSRKIDELVEYSLQDKSTPDTKEQTH
jgi:hypothetical protein